MLVLALVGSGVLVVRDGDRAPLERARALVREDGGFDTGLEAGATLAKVAQHLEGAVEACRHGGPRITCQSLSAALGYTQVMAALVLQCTAPGRFEARARTAAYLSKVAAVTPRSPRVPAPPPLPDCTA